MFADSDAPQQRLGKGKGQLKSKSRRQIFRNRYDIVAMVRICERYFIRSTRETRSERDALRLAAVAVPLCYQLNNMLSLKIVSTFYHCFAC